MLKYYVGCKSQMQHKHYQLWFWTQSKCMRSSRDYIIYIVDSIIVMNALLVLESCIGLLSNYHDLFNKQKQKNVRV